VRLYQLRELLLHPPPRLLLGLLFLPFQLDSRSANTAPTTFVTIKQRDGLPGEVSGSVVPGKVTHGEDPDMHEHESTSGGVDHEREEGVPHPISRGRAENDGVEDLSIDDDEEKKPDSHRVQSEHHEWKLGEKEGSAEVETLSRTDPRLGPRGGERRRGKRNKWHLRESENERKEGGKADP
jgi:hypothetical protein